MQFLSTIALLSATTIGTFADDGWTEQFFMSSNCDKPSFMNISGSGPVDCANLAFGSTLPIGVVYDYDITAWTEPDCGGTGIGDKGDGGEGIYCVNQALTDGASFQSYSIAAK